MLMISRLLQVLAFGLSFAIDFGSSRGLGRHDADIPKQWLGSLRRSEYAFSVLYVSLESLLPEMTTF